jgi:hypothetical protein
MEYDMHSVLDSAKLAVPHVPANKKLGGLF